MTRKGIRQKRVKFEKPFFFSVLEIKSSLYELSRFVQHIKPDFGLMKINLIKELTKNLNPNQNFQITHLVQQLNSPIVTEVREQTLCVGVLRAELKENLQ
jgi:hypothetical protein